MVLIKKIKYLHEPSTTLTKYQKRAYEDRGKIFNKLPAYITELALRKKSFVSNLKKYLINKACCSVEQCRN